MRILLFLYICFNFMFSSSVFANTIPQDVHLNPAAAADLVAHAVRMEREFLYCMSDIEFFDVYNTDYCNYTRSKINELLNKYQLGEIKSSEDVLFYNFLDIIRHKFALTRGADNELIRRFK